MMKQSKQEESVALIDELPDWIDAEAWRGFCEMRRLKKKPLTGNAVTRLFKALERLKAQGEDVALVLNQSEDQGYTGVFPVSQNYYEARGIQKPKSAQSGIVIRLVDRSWAE